MALIFDQQNPTDIRSTIRSLAQQDKARNYYSSNHYDPGSISQLLKHQHAQHPQPQITPPTPESPHEYQQKRDQTKFAPPKTPTIRKDQNPNQFHKSQIVDLSREDEGDGLAEPGIRSATQNSQNQDIIKNLMGISNQANQTPQNLANPAPQDQTALANPGGIPSTLQDQITALQRQGLPVSISSGFRTPEHNAEVGGARDSQHMQGRAIDVPLRDMTPEQQQQVVSQFLSNPNIHGFGYYPRSNSIHLDTRPGANVAWGSDYHSGSVGTGWPDWMTGQVNQWRQNQSLNPRANNTSMPASGSVRGSYFNDTSTASGQSAMTTPGIAHPTLPMGTSVRLSDQNGNSWNTTVIDRGPATWAGMDPKTGIGRGVDISTPLMKQMGYDPTDKYFTVEPIGQQ